MLKNNMKMICHIVTFFILYVLTPASVFADGPSVNGSHHIEILLNARQKVIEEWIYYNIPIKDQGVAFKVHAQWVIQMAQIKKYSIFHQKVAAHAFIRGVQEYIKKTYLSKCVPRSFRLDNAKNVRFAFEKFLDPNYNITWHYARYISHRISELIEEVNITRKTFLDLQAKSYKISSDFIHSYNLYCMKNLHSDQCETLIECVPEIDFNHRNILIAINQEWMKRMRRNLYR